MIRRYCPQDLEQIMALWLETTITAHPFIAESYWYQAKPLVEKEYIPNADTWIYQDNGEIVGFISILDGQLIGALFVRQDKQQSGIGKALITFVKLSHPLLLLEVYPQNQRAYRFYQRMGFRTVSQNLNPDTGAVVEIMSYQKTPFTD
jgi:putative acetyltransferase